MSNAPFSFALARLTRCGAALALGAVLQAGASGELWLTHPAGTARFQQQPGALVFRSGPSSGPTIEVDAGRRYQPIDGFGYSLTGGSASHLMRMTARARASLLQELFATNGANLGVSYLRVSIGASDLNASVFSYDDVAAGQTDPALARFSLAPDRAELIPILRQVRAVAPALKIMGSPWSAPAWMKTNGDARGGSLKPEWYGAYADYFVKYVRAMAAEGIPIDAVTVQNEPLHPGNNPSMVMLAADQAAFIKGHLGPAFRAAGLDTKIVCYDHNADRPDYPIAVLNDPQARAFVDGSAFHLYGGRIEALSQVHDAHPDKHLYFTEQWIGGPGNLAGDLAWHVTHLVVGATRNWCRVVLEWNLTSDPSYEPHTDRGGCDRCLGALTLAGDTVTRNPAYYIIAHASKFIRPGSVRVASTMPDTLPNAAFLTPSGATALVVFNRLPTPVTFSISRGGLHAEATLPGGAAGTFVW